MENLKYFLLHYYSQVCMAGLCAAAAYCIRVALIAWQDAVKLDQEERSTVQRLLSPLAAQLAPQSEIQVRQLRQQLGRAGFHSEQDVRRFTFVRAAVLASALLLCALVVFGHLSFFKTLVSIPLLLLAGLRLPDSWLDRRVKQRQHRINSALPATIDLMVLCLDVGLSIEAAFERVTQEMRSMEPLMAEEAQAMMGEMGAGLTFPQALKRMADRIDIEELTSMARLISQASALGASVTQALREYSEASFNKRVMALEEHAGKISAWLVMPLTLCMLPASILVLLGPAIVSVMGQVN
jgi:tight adherence protein C